MGLPVVYTAIFGDIDVLRAPLDASGARYKVFARLGFEAPSPWEVIPHESKLGNRRHSRYCKINSHLLFPDEEITIYHDGNVQLTRPIQDYLALLGDGEIALLPHPLRSCAYAEAEACKQCNKAPHKQIDRQMDAYRKDGFPKEYGLHAAFLVIRRNTPLVAKLNEMLWTQLTKHTVRDQLSLDYCLWKLGITPIDIPYAKGSHNCGPYYRRYHHDLPLPVVHSRRKRIRYR